MPITAEHVHNVAHAYLAANPDLAEYLGPLTDLLTAGVDTTARDAWTGHVTASAIVANPHGQILVIKHRKYGGLWLQPGGHVEPGDDTLYGAALRELAEESGVRDVRPVGTAPIHIAVHPIPAYPEEPAHYHFDFRFGFTTTADIGAHQESEVDAAAWAERDDLDNASLCDAVGRMPWIAEPRLAPSADLTESGHAVGVYLILSDGEGRVLVGLRSDQVAISPNMWSLPCGSLERGEDMPAGIIREAREELGIAIDPGDVSFTHLAHVANAYGSTLAVFFTAARWTGELINAEPELCRRMEWIDPGRGLPAPFVPHCVDVIRRWTGGQAEGADAFFSTTGWATRGTRAGVA